MLRYKYGVISILALFVSCVEAKTITDNRGADYFPKYFNTEGHRVFVFDPNYHGWAVYDERGERIKTGTASGGNTWCPDIKRSCKTVIGKFKVLSKGNEYCKSGKYPLHSGGGAKMPFCMRFHPKGYAIHGSFDVPSTYNASHGCVRVLPAAAQWLSQNFLRMGDTVIVLPYKRR